MLRAIGLDHIVLQVADVERSLAWYHDVLGLAEERADEWRRGEVLFPSLRIDEGTLIDLLAAPRTGENMNHVALVVAPDTDLDALASSGTFDVVAGPSELFGARGQGRGLYVRDPDGNVVELRVYAGVTAYDFRDTTVVALAARVAARDVSARELTSGALDRIAATNDAVGAFVAVDAEAALAEADAVDARLAAGEKVGPLAGIPIGVKDLEDAKGYVTTKGSPLCAGSDAAASDSVLVARLRAAGCVVVGKTNTPEFGAKADTENPVFPPTRNPWSLTMSAGGSSGGSAAAIAAGMVPLATGSDGGGSIRIPSSACGLTGLKPSLGRVPTGGPTAPDWHHLSTRGVMARTVRDIAFALDTVVGPDPSDLRSLPMPEAAWSRSLAEVHPPLRVAWSPTLGYGRVDVEVAASCAAAVDVLAGLGTDVVEVDTVFDVDPFEPWLTLVGTYLLRTVGDRRGSPGWERSDRSLRALVDRSADGVSSVDVVRAEDECHRLNLRLVDVFRDHSLLLCPTTAGQPGPVGEFGRIDGRPDPNWVQFTYPFNLTRSPAGTVCAGFTAAGLPVGLQVVGPQHADVAVLRLLAVLEDALAVDTTAAPLA